MIIGGGRDTTFGPAVMVEMGSIYVEGLADVSFRVASFDEAEARGTIAELRALPLLTRTRGGEACDLRRLAEFLAAVSRMMAERSDIVELDLDPVRARTFDAIALDARIVRRSSIPV